MYPEALGNRTDAIYVLQPPTLNDQLLWARATNTGDYYYYESTIPNQYNAGFVSTKERVPVIFYSRFIGAGDVFITLNKGNPISSLSPLTIRVR